MGKIVVLEGLDGCGKSTQAELLVKNLKNNGYNAHLVSFPRYDSGSSYFVRGYLTGKYGSKPDDVNAYTASMFYALDRYSSYKEEWSSIYSDPSSIIVMARYVDSNAIHQMSKLPLSEFSSFLNWLYDLEYNKLGIPKPDLKIFLDMDRSVADSLITTRYEGNNGSRDIHELDYNYMCKCKFSADYILQDKSWYTLSCCTNHSLRGIDDIAKELYDLVVNL